MISRFEHLKPRALKLRTLGNSLKDIESELGIPRSTLSGWLTHVKLTRTQTKTLKRRWEGALKTARIQATQWHNTQKKLRLEAAKNQALRSIQALSRSEATTELALAMLYLGEGMKKNSQTAMGNSDPRTLKFFVACLRRIYKVPISKIKCDLHLRADQVPQRAVRFWSKALRLPLKNFIGISVDQRTKDRPTYKGYEGVCLVRCGRVDIQRKLVYIAEEFCNRVAAEINI